MATRSVAAKAAIDAVTAYLHKQPETVDVQNVEADPAYQIIDVDLLWSIRASGGIEVAKVEVKGDTKAHKTGNFAFETVSNEEINTPGCFLYTEANWLYYCLTKSDPRRLYKLPMPAVRDWFLTQRPGLFPSFKTPTLDASEKRVLYHTVGRLVPIAPVQASVPCEEVSL